ncbi:MAG: SusD/RagB family nutrient-binding outer membrane lipoprotein [Prolixibacteraceae bacterium]
MKNLSYNLFLLIAMAVILASCSMDALDEIDTDPNNPTDVSINLLLPQVQINLVNDLFAGTSARYITTYVEHTANVHLNPMLPEDTNTALWNESYDILMDLKIIIEKGTAEGNWQHVGTAKVIYAFVLGTLTDIFGDVPYSEALQGSANRNPRYDSQEAIYDALFAMLDEAVADLEKTAVTNPGPNDLLLKGNKAMWLKVAWGLKARYLNRLSNVDPAGSATQALAAVAHSFASPAEGLIFSDYTNGSTNTNPFSIYEQKQKTYAASLTILQVINSFNGPGYADPRAERWFKKINGILIGAPNGDNITDQTHTVYSGISTVNVLYGAAPQAILTYDEMKFIEAEAHFRLGDRPKANAAYRQAVTAACTRAGLTAEQVASYTSQGNVFPDDEGLTLNTIVGQKFLSFFLMQPIEAFNDYRRTGIPALYNTTDGVVKRLPYPTGELATNANAPTDINNVTIYTKKVWWAKE